MVHGGRFLDQAIAEDRYLIRGRDTGGLERLPLTDRRSIRLLTRKGTAVARDLIDVFTAAEFSQTRSGTFAAFGKVASLEGRTARRQNF